jgi:RNA-binding protein
MTRPKLTTKARSYLRKLAHHLDPVVQIGSDGLTEAVQRAADMALTQHELIKVKIGQQFEGDRKEVARELADSAGADLVQVIGRVAVLYRPRAKDLPGKPRIKLPA